MNIKEIKELVKLLVETDITELNLESDGTKVVIKKGAAGTVSTVTNVTPAAKFGTQAAVEPAPGDPQPVTVEAAQNPIPSEKEEELPANQVVIPAPMVGTFYRAPNPEAEPFVEVGKVVEAGQVLCIIEAMKLMNEIESDVRGRVVKVLVENGTPVEYGQPLFVIEKM